MADLSVWILRNSSTKELLSWSLDQFDIQIGQEEVQEDIPEEDFSIIGQKYRFTGGGVLEINGKEYYILDFSTDAVAFSPDGTPQLDVGGQDSFNLTITKKDTQGNSHTSGSDNDTLNVQAENGKVDDASVALVNGQVVIPVKSGTRKGKTKIYFEMDDIISNSFEFQTV